MSSIPILFIDHAPAMGGAENSLRLLLEHLDPDRWELHLACVKGPLAEKVNSQKVTTHLIPMKQLRKSLRSPFNLIQGVYHLARIAKVINARIMISNTTRAAVYSGPAAKISQIPFVWTMRDFWLGESKPKNTWLDKAGKNILTKIASTIVANSHATASHLPSTPKTHVIHNGIEIANFNPTLNRDSSRVHLRLPVGAQIIGMIGRLRPWKGQRRFLRMLKYILDEHPNAHGLIVGGSPFKPNDDYLAQLHNLTAALGIQGRVTFTGQLDDIRPALAAMDIFVHPGDPEPFGLVNIEAMAMAKPVIAFAHGALPEIVKHGETGLLITPDDEKAMAHAVANLLRNPSKRNEMGTAGRHRAENMFSIDQTATAFDNILHTVNSEDH